MIDFDGIPKRVCSDRQLRDEFLTDPVKVTERLLEESYAALTAGLREMCPEPRTPLEASVSSSQVAERANMPATHSYACPV